MTTVAALYVDPKGPYAGMPGVDPWDASRDATRYVGPDPVVAHPACGPWGRLFRQYRGSEGGPELALIAVEQVRELGGVLEHPAGSKLWPAAGLPRPGDPADAWSGYTVQVNQCDWGHPARKATWLYLVRVPPSLLETPAPGVPTHVIGGAHRDYTWRGRQYKRTALPTCPKRARILTPPLFAEYLVRLARAARR